MIGIIERWENMLHLLDRQLNGKVRVPDEIIDQTRLRIRRFAQDVDQSILPLTLPNPRIIKDEAFKGIRIGPPTSRDDMSQEAITEAKSTIDRIVPAKYFDVLQMQPITDVSEMARVRMELVRLKSNAYVKYKEYAKALVLVNAKYARLLAAHMTGRPPLAYRQKGVIKFYKSGPCWCGCGALAGLRYNEKRHPVGLNRFLPGHIAKYYKMIIAVETGKVRKDDIPDIPREGLLWTICDLCGGSIPAVDPYGRPLQERVGLACWRNERGIRNPYKAIVLADVVDANLALDAEPSRK